ncbi:hypothetical protein RUM43_007242 [Polyplax serrata]|uniref:NADH dehydrogenase [ubiquinone] 1 alpha subcomplex assembly factor 2 n=1 Tax=Polyplax serrata TaxID=468196 RepID=A0AAN8S7R1_POLSC
MAQGRSIYKQILTNFIESITPRKLSGTLVGKDHNGTMYYESPAKTSGSLRKSARWFVPVKKEDFDQELPPEWVAWLRHRRRYPPTEEEIQINLIKAKEVLKKSSALDSNKQEKVEQPELNRKSSFPTYKEYEINPGPPDRK